MAFQAHRTVCNLARPRSKAEVQESFTRKVLPFLLYARRVGSTYGASNFLGICGMVMAVPDLKAGDRISFFAYGSGAIGEFYSGRLCAGAREEVSRMQIDEALDAKAKGEKRVIRFNLSGHGYFDMSSYESYLAGKLEDYEYPAEAIATSMAHLPQMNF